MKPTPTGRVRIEQPEPNCAPHLFVDGVKIADSGIQTRPHSGAFFARGFNGRSDPSWWPIGEWYCRVLDLDVERRLLELPSLELWPHIAVLSLPTHWNSHGISGEICILGPSEACPEGAVAFRTLIWAEDWANPFTVDAYVGTLEATARRLSAFTEVDLSDFDRKWDDDDDRGGTFWQCDFARPLVSRESDIGLVVADYTRQWIELCQEAVRTLLINKTETLVTFFCFPQEVRSAAEQYLLYFVQFLADLGIGAQSELIHDREVTLFRVAPSDGPAALAEIRTALDTYLQLPSANALAIPGAASDVAVLQLQSNILFLQSQLELARAALQLKDAAIGSLNFTVFQQQQLIANRTPTPSSSDDEEAISDIVSVTKYRGEGFTVDLPTLVRRLKRAFRSK